MAKLTLVHSAPTQERGAMFPVAELDDAELLSGIARAGSMRALSRELGVHPSAITKSLQRRGLTYPPPKPEIQKPKPTTTSSPLTTPPSTRGAKNPPKARPRLTATSLSDALLPANGCRVRAFLDQLDEESRAVLDEALSYDRRDLPAARLSQWLLSQGFPEADVPGRDAISNHRTGTRPCRCRG